MKNKIIIKIEAAIRAEIPHQDGNMSDDEISELAYILSREEIEYDEVSIMAAVTGFLIGARR